MLVKDELLEIRLCLSPATESIAALYTSAR
jgi:hypothetical protein